MAINRFDFGGFRVFMRDAAYRMAMEIYISKHNGNHVEVMKKDGEFVDIKDGMQNNEGPTIILPMGAMQSFFDALWEQGFRPKDRRYEAEMSLVKNHLEDMRSLVFKKEPKQ